jgi:hypothetical protein
MHFPIFLPPAKKVALPLPEVVAVNVSRIPFEANVVVNALVVTVFTVS